MNPTITIELDVSPTSPENQWISSILKATLEIEVRCPQQECLIINPEVISQLDSKNQESYCCTRCKTSFALNESNFYREAKTNLFDRLIESCIMEGRTETAISKVSGESQPTVSRVITEITQKVLKKEHQLKRLVQKQGTQIIEQNNKEFQSVQTDETFLSVEGATHFPTWTVDQSGELLHYEWLENRTSETIGKYISDLHETTGPNIIHVHDGLYQYHQTIVEKMGSSLEIVHLHKAPKGRVLVIGTERTAGCHCFAEHILGVSNRSLQGLAPLLGWYAVKITRCEKHSCLCLNNLCLEDDHLSFCQPCLNYPEQIKKEHLWKLRWPQDVFKSGLMFSWEKSLGESGVPFISQSWFETFGKREEFGLWMRGWVQTLITTLYQVFPNTSATTNRIERHHALFKDHLEWRGHRKPKHVKAWFLTWIAKRYFPKWFLDICNQIKRKISTRFLFWNVFQELYSCINRVKGW